MENVRFDGKVAVITGAGGGLGKAYALLLAARGVKVVVNDLGGTFDGSGSDATPAQLVVNEIKAAGGEAVANYDSVADWESAQKIIQTAIDSYGTIDILINNAGILRDKSLLKMEMEDYRKIMSVHLDGTFFCTKAAFAKMKEQAYGRIVSTASAAGLYGNFGQTNYGAAKMGIAGMMNCVAQEGARYNIMANTIIPTAGTRLTFTVIPEEVIAKVKPEFVAPIVAWLCSEGCKESGKMFSAGGGYFSRAAVVEGPGIVFNSNKEITVEMVVDKLDQIMSLEGGSEFSSAMEQAGTIMSRMIIE
ncbi:MAG TPA: SDR family oxidoreductase [Candidatus Limnocylindrales bacterium]|nr:SDR family oxidoreductase [Candidatus Limnocylindrales bacterium]